MFNPVDIESEQSVAQRIGHVVNPAEMFHVLEVDLPRVALLLNQQLVRTQDLHVASVRTAFPSQSQPHVDELFSCHQTFELTLQLQRHLKSGR